MINERYMIIDHIGEGGMANVYLAIDTILNREVAIKILRGELGKDPVALLRFQREANAASKLNHPNVVNLYDVGEYKGKHYIVMEYIRGRTLKQLIQQRGALHQEEAVDIMMQLASAVQHAHEHHIIHRDIKPQNVLLKDDGTVKITDFGIAVAHNAVQLTQNDAILGSAHYLAPETTRGENATSQIDIYALGIVFYELLTGSVPFQGDNPVQIAFKHLREEIPSVKEFNPTLPQSIENIILKATIKNRNFRYQTAKEMLNDLAVCLLPQQNNVAKIKFDERLGDPTRVIGDQDDTDLNEMKSRKKRKQISRSGILILVLVTLISLLALFGILYMSGVVDESIMIGSTKIPDVVEIDEDKAIQQLIDAGFWKVNIKLEKAMSDDIEAGKVMKIEPSVGSKVRKNSVITITISKGVYFIIDDYVNKNIQDIKPLLEAEGIKVIVEKKQDASLDGGTILVQNNLHKGDKIDPQKSNEIKFIVSQRPTFIIPDVIGMSISEARSLLHNKGALVVLKQKSMSGMSEEEIANLQTGVVIECIPKEGTTYIQEKENVITLTYY